MKNSLPIAGGVSGAVAGFVATALILGLVDFGNPTDPIASSLLVLFVFAPAGAIAGLLLSTKLAMRWWENAGGFGSNSFKALIALIVFCAAAARFTTSLRSRLPHPGSTRMPPIRFLSLRFVCLRQRRCQAQPATSPSNCRPISTPCRANQASTGSATTATGRSSRGKSSSPFAPRIGSWRLRSRASPVAFTQLDYSELGPWQPRGDGSEIRYRAKWPGQD
jgi:hypothetical protein